MKFLQINWFSVFSILFAFLIFSINLHPQQTWEQSNGPYGGSILSFDVSPNGTLFAGTYAGGVFRSTDNGDYWRPSNAGLANLNVHTLGAGPDNYVYVIAAGLLHRSSDNGDSWVDISGSNPSVENSSIYTNSIGEVFIISVFSAIYKSTDHGDTWQLLNLLHSAYSLFIDTNDDMYAGVYGGMEKSTDNGSTWTYTSFTSNNVESICLSSQGDIYAGVFWDGIYWSTDDGSSWTQINTGLPTPLNSVTITDFAVDDNNIMYAAVNTDNILGSGLYYHDPSRDGFAGPYWYLSQEFQDRRLVEVEFVQTSAGLFLNPDDAAGLLRFNNPPDGTVENASTGLAATDVEDIKIDLSGTLPSLIAAGDLSWGPKYSYDIGNTWYGIDREGLPNLGSFLEFERLMEQISQDLEDLLVGSYFDLLGTWVPCFGIRNAGSNDGPGPWEIRTNGLTGTLLNGVAVDNSTGNIMASGDQKMFFTSDQGLNWIERSNNLPPPVFGVEFNENNNTWYTKTWTAVHKSTDDGLSWSVFANIPSPTSIDINKSNNMVAVGAPNNTISVCDEMGNCITLTTGWPGTWVDLVKYDPNGQLWAATTASGIYFWDENLNSWQNTGSGLEGTLVRDLEFEYSAFNRGGSNIVYAATAGRGVWTLNAPTGVDDEKDKLPESFSLSQNYPNPFNPSTKINWQSPVGGYQILKVYDVLGNEITTLVDEYKPAGTYEVEFDASGLPSGIYFYKLSAGDPSTSSGKGFVESKKMILLK